MPLLLADGMKPFKAVFISPSLPDISNIDYPGCCRGFGTILENLPNNLAILGIQNVVG